MIKQYDFPRIFQNVVGEVIPIIAKNREAHIKYFNLGSQQTEEAIAKFHLKEQQYNKGKLTLKSKKKEIVRRMKFNKTLGCFSLRKYQSQEDKSSQIDNQSHFKNFLKRKQFNAQKTQKTQGFKENIQKNAEFQESIGHEDQLNSNIAQPLPVKTSKRHMSSIRLRTSIDQYTKYEMDKAIQEITRSPNKRISQISQINPNLCIKEPLPTRSKIKHRTFFNYDINKEDKLQGEDGENRNSDRKRTKKKTVNFIVLEDEKENSDTKNISRKGSKMANNMQRQGKLNPNTNKKPSSKQLSKTQVLNQSSQWSAKTVISIKFDSNCQANSKRSLRSQQSILLNSNTNFAIKKTKSNNRYGTKTFLKFTQRGQMSLKKYKSMKSISQVSIEIKSQKSMKRSKVKNKLPNKTLVISSNVKKILKAQNQNKAASILVKTSQPYLITDSVKSIEHKTNTFQDLIFKKSTKNLFKSLRPNTEPDIFTELNNFHKYLNENDADQNDQDLQRVLTKPMILNSQTTLQRAQRDPQLQIQQNFIIDMGLNLIKKMSILKQKKF